MTRLCYFSDSCASPEFSGQDDDQLNLLRYLHLHGGVVPDERAPPAAGHLLHDGPHRVHVRAADTSVGWSVYYSTSQT